MSIQSIALSQNKMLEEINHLAKTAGDLPVTSNPLSGAEGEQADVSFNKVMSNAMHQVNSLQEQAEISQTAVDTGQSDDLAGTMLASQQAALSFSALVQVRNKLATGFNDLMSMSI
ncbi:flagellar hook-basal body complex protein FliE [Siccibacter turicensis]